MDSLSRYRHRAVDVFGGQFNDDIRGAQSAGATGGASSEGDNEV
uniref:Uncharacterized protein n=1 Tax=Lotus japonicus TaxID=34305 RepID=I3SUI5_LOTJA|nr:unknown [Lotus japonicus]